MPTIVPGRLIGTTVHFIHELNGLVFHQLSGMEVTFTRNFHGTVAKAALYLLDVDSGFAQLGGVGMPEAVEVEFAVTQLCLYDMRCVLRNARLDVCAVSSDASGVRGMSRIAGLFYILVE